MPGSTKFAVGYRRRTMAIQGTRQFHGPGSARSLTFLLFGGGWSFLWCGTRMRPSGSEGGSLMSDGHVGGREIAGPADRVPRVLRE